MLAVIIVLLAPGVAAVDSVMSEHLDLIQRQSVITDHQRLVGNIRAQARREGVVVQVPQLYVYLYDHSASWHLDGFRRGFERELNLTVNRQRRARSMVRLDRLLERVTDPAGDVVRIADLPAGDVFILLYRRDDCDECEQVEQAVSRWLAETSDLSAVWIDVWMDRLPEE
jgi:hypothetical protein